MPTLSKLGIFPSEKGAKVLSENNNKPAPPLPPVIAELLKQKGWSWPLSEPDRKQIGDALRALSGSFSVPEELWNDVFEGVRGFENAHPKTSVE